MQRLSKSIKGLSDNTNAVDRDGMEKVKVVYYCECHGCDVGNKPCQEMKEIGWVEYDSLGSIREIQDN